jgi:hypothetical protein
LSGPLGSSLQPPRARVLRSLFDALTSAPRPGLFISARGWPDFFCLSRKAPHVPAFVYAAKHRGRRLRSHQAITAAALAAYGVPVYRYDPHTGFDQLHLPSSKLVADSDNNRGI